MLSLLLVSQICMNALPCLYLVLCIQKDSIEYISSNNFEEEEETSTEDKEEEKSKISMEFPYIAFSELSSNVPTTKIDQPLFIYHPEIVTPPPKQVSLIS